MSFSLLGRNSSSRLCRTLAIFVVCAFTAWRLLPTPAPTRCSLRRKAQSSAQAGGCIFPQLELYTPEIRAFYKTIRKPICSTDGETNWIGVHKGRLVIAASAEARHGKISCVYMPFKRVNDYEVKWLDRVENVSNGFRLQTDFFRAECRAASGATFTVLDAAIAPVAAPTKPADSSTSPLFGLNVVMLALDSVSRLAFMRTLPKTYRFLTSVLGAVVLQGYNIVGDGTPQALIPIFTGKTEEELPLTRKRFANAQYVNVYPMIWNDFKAAGYATLYDEDSVHAGTFTYRLKGFDAQPTDHYIRTFYVEMKKRSDECNGYRVGYEYFFDHVHHFVEAYPERPKFAFAITDLTHNDPSSASMVDDDLLEHLRRLNDDGVLNETILVVMSDHGLRYGGFRATQQGKLEERLPFVSIVLPPRVRAEYPQLIQRLTTNAERLSTPFDLHATLRSVLNFSSDAPSALLQRRGISMLEAEIPRERNCADAGIEPHWCTCLDWTEVAPEGRDVEFVTRLAQTLVDRINEATASERENCVELQLKETTSVLEFAPKAAMLGYQRAKDLDGFVPDVREGVQPSSLLYQVSIVVTPGNNRYESTLEYDCARREVRKPRIETISITNAYGDKPHCVLARNPFLAKFCVCPDRL